MNQKALSPNRPPQTQLKPTSTFRGREGIILTTLQCGDRIKGGAEKERLGNLADIVA